MKKRLIIVDGNAILHRAWHAMPPLQTKDGRLVSAAYGFTTMLMKVLKELEPTHVAVTFDLPGGTFRHEAFEKYKAHRVKQPQELYDQIPMVKRVLDGYGIPVFEAEGYEADDVIGTLSKIVAKDVETIIVTGDLDTLQLVDKRTKVYTLRKGISDVVIYDEAAVRQRYGLSPDQLIDYKALRGDTSDNIPGLRGIGEKGASELLQKHGTIEGIYRALKKDPNSFKPRLVDALTSGEKDVPLSKQLVTIVRDVPIDFSLEKTKLGPPDMAALAETFRDLEFRTLLPKVQREAASTGTSKSAGRKQPASRKKEADSEIFAADAAADFRAAFSGAGSLAFRFVYAGGDRIAPRFAGLALCDGKRSAAIPFGADGIPAPIRTLLAGATRLIGHDVKDDMTALASIGLDLPAETDDTMIMSYLLNPGSRAHKLSDLIFDSTGKAAPAQQDTLFAEDRLASASAEAASVFGICDALEAKLKDEKLQALYRDVERPLIPVLSAMERHGIKVDAAFLKRMGEKMQKRLDELSASITEAAREPFNINSPAQLQRILFEVLKLPTKGIKKTGTGQLSTGADELEKLRGEHPIIKQIFEHREYSKLLSTYVTAIPLLIDAGTKRLHSHYNQAVAATGRLSSSDPNLQNIPIRTELGREIRKAFIAEKGCKLIAADYSQIELRIAASIANDGKMIEAFKAKADIHTATAAEIWEVAPDQVTFEQRRAAKAINFGILYGMGANSLAASAGLSVPEARNFIKKYLTVYKGLQSYMDEAKAQAKTLGYVETLFGRKRYLPEINSGVPFVRAEAERMAVNMPIQGTNADIIKMAMIKLHARIGKKYGFGKDADVKMLLQVHDELVFEVREPLVKEASGWIREAMEGVAELKVPIDVEVETGDTWGDLEAL
jgi:DNA polymerase-1